MPFELPPWLTEPAHPFESFAKGASVGVALGQAFSQNVYRNQALYVRARQDQQEQELQFRQLAQRDADFSLRSEVARTKMAHDTEDFETLKAFVPTVSSALTFDELNKMQLPPLHDTSNYLKMSAMLDRTKTEKAMGEMAGELAPTTNWADPKVREIILKWEQKAPDITLMPATQHLLGRHQAAVVAQRTANRLEQDMQSRADNRTARADIAARVEERRALLNDTTIDLNDARIRKLDAEIAGMDRTMALKEATLELGKNKLELQNLLAAGNVALTDARVQKLNSDIALGERGMALKESNQALNENKFQLQQLIADHTIPLTDARVVKLQKEIAMAEREMAVKEKHAALRGQEIDRKETQLVLREKYLNERNAIDREEKAKLATMSADSPEADATRKFLNLKRREVWRKFYGPNPTNAPTPRADLQPDPTRGTNAPPAVVAPADENIRRQGGNLFQQQPDGTWKYLGPAQ